MIMLWSASIVGNRDLVAVTQSVNVAESILYNLPLLPTTHALVLVHLLALPTFPTFLYASLMAVSPSYAIPHDCT